MAEQTFKHIVRISNVDLPGDKPIKISLKKIKGVGFNLAAAACHLAGVNKDKKTGDLTETEIKKLTEIINVPTENGIPVWMINQRKEFESGEDKHVVISDLRLKLDADIKRMMRTKSYKGIRHSNKLPVRGQRTKAHFRKGSSLGVKKPKRKGK